MFTKKWKLLLWLGYINLFISSFTFGGGYVVVPMVRKYFVEQKKLFAEERLMSMAAVAQSSPGAIAVNLSALAGLAAGGVPGLIISATAAVIPPLAVLSAVSYWYDAFSGSVLIAAVLKGMQAGAAAAIVDCVVDMAQMILKEHSRLLTAMIPLVFAGSFFLHIHAALLLGTCCLLCILKVYVRLRKEMVIP